MNQADGVQARENFIASLLIQKTERNITAARWFVPNKNSIWKNDEDMFERPLVRKKRTI
jgi:hypothetical protein